jgi:6-phosphogluconolactonase
VALSGGSTPQLLFSLLGEKYARNVAWHNVHLFWGDERCVPPDDQESNYGVANEKFIAKSDIPLSNVHRIRGEDPPEIEALRYSVEIEAFTVKRNGKPSFDLMVLGIGEDGHTASIFPGHTILFASEKICEVAVHPETRQKRITLTGKVINNSAALVFLVTGKKKAGIVRDIIEDQTAAINFPASYVNPVDGELSWYLDEEASSLLGN